jgi:hypothetical protein
MSLTTKFDQFIIEGLCSVQDSRMIDLIEIESCLFRDARQSFSKKYISEVEKEGLEKIQAYILDNYLKSHFYNVQPHSFGLWKGIDQNSHNWHNDYLKHKKFNITCLYYLDDMDNNTGGSLQVRSLNSFSEIYPKEEMLVILNQSKTFEHRVVATSHIRRLLSFDFFAPELEN